MEFLLHILAGAGVGFLIGLTGVGGGSLMTPLLLLFGYPAPIAIGTDLLYASLTKAGGAIAHHRQGHVQWRIVFTLAAGSVPSAVFLHVFVLNFSDFDPESYEKLLTSSLGYMLIVTSIVLFFRDFVLKRSTNKQSAILSIAQNNQSITTFVMGVLLGICVTLSSVGAGAFCAAMLLVLYSNTAATHIVGTDIAHAVPLTLVAGLGYLIAGNVDLLLLLSLLIGSLPAINLGSRLSRRVPDTLLQQLLATTLLVLGGIYATL